MSDSQEELARLQREIDQAWEESKRLSRSSSAAPQPKSGSSLDSPGTLQKPQKPGASGSGVRWLIALPLCIAFILFFAQRLSPKAQNNMIWTAIGFSAGVVATKVVSRLQS